MHRRDILNRDGLQRVWMHARSCWWKMLLKRHKNFVTIFTEADNIAQGILTKCWCSERADPLFYFLVWFFAAVYKT